MVSSRKQYWDLKKISKNVFYKSLRRQQNIIKIMIKITIFITIVYDYNMIRWTYRILIRQYNVDNIKKYMN